MPPTPPTAFPAPGTYAVEQRVSLLATPVATIHYTTDGSTPTTTSPVCGRDEVIFLPALNDGNTGLHTTTTISAIAVRDGQASGVARFGYTIARRDQDSYVVHELMPGFFVIRDYDNVNMYFIKGSTRSLLIDAGMGTGNLRTVIEPLRGDVPMDVFITHGHGDHVTAMGQFEDTYDVYMSHIDMPMVQSSKARGGLTADLSAILDVREGMVFDLGTYRFTVYALPGHSAGSMMLFDEAKGLLIAGDAIGSNKAGTGDALWMQYPSMWPIDHYLSALQSFRAKVAGRVKLTFGGHNDWPILGEAYMDNLEAAAQRLIDAGPDSLVPSLRPAGVWMAIEGDRMTDPNWASINVTKEACLSQPYTQIASLSNIVVLGGVLTQPIAPLQTRYTLLRSQDTAVTITPVTTSRQISRLTINGIVVQPRVPFAVGNADALQIVVTAADGISTAEYVIAVNTV